MVMTEHAIFILFFYSSFFYVFFLSQEAFSFFMYVSMLKPFQGKTQKALLFLFVSFLNFFLFTGVTRGFDTETNEFYSSTIGRSSQCRFIEFLHTFFSPFLSDSFFLPFFLFFYSKLLIRA